jgi:hypothetical protein
MKRNAMKRKPHRRKRRSIKVTSRGKDTMTPREIAFESGLGLRSVYDEICKGRLRHMKVGPRRIISRIAYNEWLAGLGRNAA